MLVFMAGAHRGPLHNHPLLTAGERRDIWVRFRPRRAPRDSILLQTRHRATSGILLFVMARWPELEPPIWESGFIRLGRSRGRIEQSDHINGRTDATLATRWSRK